MDLTTKDRILLINQCRIIEALYPDEAASYATWRKALEEGYAIHYLPDAMVYSDGLDEESCKEVLNILEVHRALHDSVQQLGSGTTLKPKDVEFTGFDGNNEANYMSYAQYFVKDLGRFQELDTGDFNSHAPMLDKYRRMSAAWNALGRKRPMTESEIRSVRDA